MEAELRIKDPEFDFLVITLAIVIGIVAASVIYGIRYC